MSQATANRREPEPLPENLRSVQPGGGACYEIELAWGRLRRRLLKRFRPGYVERMRQNMQGSAEGALHKILDPRDLKYCRNQCTAEWAPADDPFLWREHLGFARWGLAELQIMAYPLLAVTIALALTRFWYLAIGPAVVLGLIVWFFRDPARNVPVEPGLLVSPADGKIVEILEVAHDEFIGGPAVRIGIFLSIFNVHINRAPAAARILKLEYRPGKFLNALDPKSLIENEALFIGMEEGEFPHRPLWVRQIAGLFARRIVCNLRPGEVVERGQKFGMIKLGSRTEIAMPADPQLHVLVKLGENVSAGSTVLCRYGTAK